MTNNVDVLAAYLEGLAAEIDHTHFTAEVLEAAAELRRLLAERDSLLADAERYRWLKANAGFGIRQNQVTELSVMLYALPNHMGEIDAAIDAMLAERNKK